MVETVEEWVWRERPVEEGFPPTLITISYLLNPEVHVSEDVMSKSLLRKPMVPGDETKDHDGPRKAASNVKTGGWLG